MEIIEANFSHRPVREEDLEMIVGFAVNEEELFYFYPKANFPLTAQQLRSSIDSRMDSTVVEMNGEVIGFANFYHWEDGGSCSIGNVVVNPHLRGRGAGRYLMKVMISLARSKYRAREIRVSCFNRNTSALLLYRSLGFLPFDVEDREDKQGNRVALVHMRLLIQQDPDSKNDNL
jgi:ribosomal protein S18 acetylase RimI-like enzyme